MTTNTPAHWKVIRDSNPDAGPDLLPSFGPGGRPQPESRSRLLRVHAFAVLTLIFGFTYLIWRYVDTINLDVWWVALPLIAAWFDSWRTLTFILLPAAVIFTGASPIDAPGRIYLPMFLLAFFSQFLLLRLLARGYYPPILSLVFEMLRLPAILPATFAVAHPSQTSRLQSYAEKRARAP